MLLAFLTCKYVEPYPCRCGCIGVHAVYTSLLLGLVNHSSCMGLLLLLLSAAFGNCLSVFEFATRRWRPLGRRWQHIYEELSNVPLVHSCCEVRCVSAAIKGCWRRHPRCRCYHVKGGACTSCAACTLPYQVKIMIDGAAARCQ